MLHRERMIAILLGHLDENHRPQRSTLREIEVWYNGELLPAWRLALRGLPAAVADLPSSFCRALMYGENYRDVLAKTLQVIRDPAKPFLEYAYEELQQAIVAENIDAVEMLVMDIKCSGLSNFWLWMIKNREPLFESPGFLSIRLSNRNAFDKI
jgi:hypothetical protein